MTRGKDATGISASEEKWGKPAISAGFTVLPNHFLAINEFVDEGDRLSPTEMLVTLQILLAWWSKDRMPFPSKATIAARSGLSPRQVQRALTALEEKGYVKRVGRFTPNRARTSNQFELSGLVSAVMHAAQSYPAAFKRPVVSFSQVEDE